MIYFKVFILKQEVKDLTIKNNDDIFHAFGSDSPVDFISKTDEKQTRFSIEEFLRRLWYILGEENSFLFFDNEKWISLSYGTLVITRTLPAEDLIRHY